MYTEVLKLDCLTTTELIRCAPRSGSSERGAVGAREAWSERWGRGRSEGSAGGGYPLLLYLSITHNVGTLELFLALHVEITFIISTQNLPDA